MQWPTLRVESTHKHISQLLRALVEMMILLVRVKMLRERGDGVMTSSYEHAVAILNWRGSAAFSARWIVLNWDAPKVRN
jgi:hypothetical protein